MFSVRAILRRCPAAPSAAVRPIRRSGAVVASTAAQRPVVMPHRRLMSTENSTGGAGSGSGSGNMKWFAAGAVTLLLASNAIDSVYRSITGQPSRADAEDPIADRRRSPYVSYAPPAWFKNHALYDLASQKDFVESVLDATVLPAEGSTSTLPDGKLPPAPASNVKWDKATERKVVEMLTRAQNEICRAVETAEGPNGVKFDERRSSTPTRAGQIYRITRVLQDGMTFEKAGCSITCSYSQLPLKYFKDKVSPEPTATNPNPTRVGWLEPYLTRWTASGAKAVPVFTASMSLVFHPLNPHAPTVHANYRYFEVDDGSGTGETISWFGGGSDLTPNYLYADDVTHFHTTLATAAAPHDPKFYPNFKKWADQYFFLPHRREGRGVGGMFFDHQSAASASPLAATAKAAPNSIPSGSAPKTTPQLVAFVSDLAAAVVPSYIPILNKRKDMPYERAQRSWAALRHGRYVEFNLLNDEGTSYGLKNPNADVEGIFMSLPRSVTYAYRYEPKPDSPEHAMLSVLKTPRENWLAPTAAPAVAAAAGAPPATKSA